MVLVSLIRCIVSIVISTTKIDIGTAERALWVIVRFFLLSTEISVVIFCLAFGHLDSRSSTRYVLLATSFLSLSFSITQGILEMNIIDQEMMPTAKHVFHHGGLIFWMISSLIFTLVYLIVLLLPWTRLRDRLVLPSKNKFFKIIFN